MLRIALNTRLCGLAAFALLGSLAWSDSLTGVADRNAQNAHDAIAWSQLGADGVAVPSTFVARSAAGVPANIQLSGSKASIAIACPGLACSWTGAGFSAGDALLWTRDTSSKDSAPIVLTFERAVAGAGAFIQPDAPGPFKAEIQAFNGSAFLGSFSLTSEPDGRAAYIGIQDPAGAHITSVMFRVTECQSACSDFAIGPVDVNDDAGPTAELTPSSAAFGNVPLGTTSAPHSFTLKNTGTETLDIYQITASARFAETNDCGSSLSQGASCTITVTFTPSQTGKQTGTLTVYDNTLAGAQNSSLTGTGTNVELSPTSLTFPATAVGQSSPAETVTLTNAGTVPFNVSAVSIVGADAADFGQTNTCTGVQLAAGASCNISVTFHPKATGARTASLSIEDTGFGSPQSVALSGTGSGPAPTATLSPSGLTFGTIPIGLSSASKTLKLTNTSSTATLTIGQIQITGDFSETNTCGSSLTPGSSCTITVTFTPTTTGTRTGSVTVFDNTAAASQSATLTGTGTNVELSPKTLVFPSTTVAEVGPTKSATLTNVGTAEFEITAISLGGADPGDFSQTNSCVGLQLAPKASCTINVTFHPKADGVRTAFVSITDTGFGSPQQVSLSGTGTGSAATATLSPSGGLTFAVQPIGTTTAAQTLTLTNTSSITLNIFDITINGDFAQTNNCGSSLSPGSSCNIMVTFTPTATGVRTGSITVYDNTFAGSQSATLTGTGTNVELSPPSLSFPATQVGDSSSPETVTLTNVGNTSFRITEIVIAGTRPSDFSQTNTCAGNNGHIAPGASCTITVTFHPKATGARIAFVSIHDNGFGGQQGVRLIGVGK